MLPPRAAPEDRAWLNGKVFTGRGFAESLLVEGGEVRAVGPRDAVLRSKATGTDRVDLHGRLIIPGLSDLHMHLAATARNREGIELRGARSLSEIGDRVQAGMARTPSGPLVGFGWDQENLAEGRYPNRDDLDRVAPERPVILFRVCGHAAVLNSAALDLIGLADRLEDPPGGRYGRDASGRIDGVLFDAALAGLDRIEAEWTRENAAALGRTLEYAASVGLTTIAPVLASPEEVVAVDELCREGTLPVSVRFYLDLNRISEIDRLPTTGRTDWRLTGVKAILDGSLGARTAWLEEPYADARGITGFPLWEEGRLMGALSRARQRDLAPALHAIGDRTLRWILELLRTVPPFPSLRVEHASLVPPSLLPLLDVVRPDLVVQPHFVVTDWWTPARLGTERARWAYAWRTLWDRGLRLGGSSDSPVEPLDPWTGLRAAVQRAPATDFGRLTAGERLAPVESFQMYTRNAGPILGEPRLGTLEPGAPGDFLVLSVPSLDAALRAPRPPVAETWRGGRCMARPAAA
jgi:predicted amidohydrolase YtcJ